MLLMIESCDDESINHIDCIYYSIYVKVF